MYIRGNKLIELLEEFKSTNPKKEDRIPYREWRRLVNFLTNSKNTKFQVKTEPNTLIITSPGSGEQVYFNTGDYFIKFFQERPITTIFPSPKFEHFWGDNTTFITDNDGNRFITSNSDLELSDYRISDVEHKEIYTPVFNTPIINDPYNGQLYYQSSDRTWESLAQYYDTDSTSSYSDTLNISTPPYDATTINTLDYLQPFIADWGNPPYSAEKATKALKNLTENLSKGSSNKMNLNLNNLFDFGPINDNVVMYSPYGLAFRNSNNQYLTYNPTTKKTTDVTGLTIDLEGLIYKVPVGLNSVKPGDIIIHNGKPICVEGIEDHSVICVDIENSELKTVIPPTNIFGFNYVTKITPLFNLGSANPSEDNPFGNIIPYLLFSSLTDSVGDKSGNSFDIQTLLLMSMMNNADGNFFGNIFGNGQA